VNATLSAHSSLDRPMDQAHATARCDSGSGSDLRVAEMLESQTEPSDATASLRKLGGAIIRRLVAAADLGRDEAHAGRSV
jgi:hypothetical protein